MKKAKDVQFGQIVFYCKFSNPTAYKKSKNPCRALITPRDPRNGKLITKRQLYETDSDEFVNYCVRGKSPNHIIQEIFPQAAQHLIGKMQEMGMIDAGKNSPDSHDLAALGRAFEEQFFSQHIEKDHWHDSTVEKYRGQYSTLMGELEGVPAEIVDTEQYKALQLKICLNALKDSGEYRLDFKYGDKAPSSGQARTNLLNLLIWDLKMIDGRNIPVAPFPYKGKRPRNEELKIRAAHVRCYPQEDLHKLFSTPKVTKQGLLMVDCGLRIGENAGSLWVSLHSITGSQGILYYLTVTGQVTPFTKVRTEITKTDTSYRSISISQELGEYLIHQKQQLTDKYGDVNMRLMCAKEENGRLMDDAKTARQYLTNIADAITDVLRSEDVIDHQKEFRIIEFDKERQAKALKSELTCHSLRRNFCTWMHCSSGLDVPEIYRQMGHAFDDGQKKSSWRGLTKDELYQMCLRRYVSGTWWYPAHPLRYDAISKYTATEVPTCGLELTLHPGESVELILKDTEPDNQIHLRGENLDMELLRAEESTESVISYALLANSSKTQIHKICHPFDIDEKEGEISE